MSVDVSIVNVSEPSHFRYEPFVGISCRFPIMGAVGGPEEIVLVTGKIRINKPVHDITYQAGGPSRVDQ